MREKDFMLILDRVSGHYNHNIIQYSRILVSIVDSVVNVCVWWKLSEESRRCESCGWV